MGATSWGFKKSLWVFHLNAGACNNCDIEVLDCLTPRFDVERFGIKLVGSVKHADVLLVSGSVPRKIVPQVIVATAVICHKKVMLPGSVGSERKPTEMSPGPPPGGDPMR